MFSYLRSMAALHTIHWKTVIMFVSLGICSRFFFSPSLSHPLSVYRFVQFRVECARAIYVTHSFSEYRLAVSAERHRYEAAPLWVSAHR